MSIQRRNHGQGHSYTVEGVKTPGVTTILQMAPKTALIDWAARTSADCAVNEWDELAALPLTKRHDRIKTAHNRDRDQAAGKGTAVHKLAERWDRGEDIQPPDALAGHFYSYLDFRKRIPFKSVAVELVIANRAVGYCGTTDLIADMPAVTCDGETIPATRWILDLKTSRSGIWPESALQTCAYMHSEVYLRGTDEYPMADLGVTRAGAVHIRADGWDLRPLDTGSDVWDYFLHLAALYAARDTERDRLGPPGSWVGYAIDPDAEPVAAR